MRAPRAAFGSVLSAKEWIELIARLGEIPDPTVAGGPSSAAMPDPAGTSRRERRGRKVEPVATVSPPQPLGHAACRLRASSRPVPPVARGRCRRALCRALAVGALGIVVLIAAYLVFSGGGGADYHLEMKEAGQLVRGDQVQVGGVPVGQRHRTSQLTPDFKARVTIHVDSSLTPLHAGTIAEIRVPSLTGVANRFVALTPGPNNRPALRARGDAAGERDAGSRRSRPAVQHAEPEDAQGLAAGHPGLGRTVRRGRSRSWARRPNTSRPRSPPTDHFFAELARDQSTFTELPRRIGEGVDDDRARARNRSATWSNTAIRPSRRSARSRAASRRACAQLPVTLKEGNKTFAEIPSTLSALTELVHAQQPNIAGR